jgi:hypothetical protein
VRGFFMTLGFLVMSTFTAAQTLSGTGAEVWTASWGSSQQLPESQNALPLVLFRIALNADSVRRYLCSRVKTY